jgi:hypothetical protein
LPGRPFLDYVVRVGGKTASRRSARGNFLAGLVAVALLSAGPFVERAAAQFDVTGRWYVLGTALAPDQTPLISVSCPFDFAQQGTALTVTGSCDILGGIAMTGTIDPGAGIFTVSGSSEALCIPSFGGLSFSGQLTPDGASFNGTLFCGGFTGILAGARCTPTSCARVWDVQGRAGVNACTGGRCGRHRERFSGQLVVEFFDFACGASEAPCGRYRIPGVHRPSRRRCPPIPDEVGLIFRRQNNRWMLAPSNLKDVVAAVNACLPNGSLEVLDYSHQIRTPFTPIFNSTTFDGHLFLKWRLRSVGKTLRGVSFANYFALSVSGPGSAAESTGGLPSVAALAEW